MSDKDERIKFSILGISSVCLSLFIVVNLLFFYFLGCKGGWNSMIMPLSVVTAVLAVAAIIQRCIVKRRLWWLSFGGLVGPVCYLKVLYDTFSILMAM